MKINLNKKNNENLQEDEIYLELQCSQESQEVEQFIDYINNYKVDSKNNVVFLTDDNNLIEIDIKDIIIFYSDKKYNYCKVKDNRYRIKSKLYELEKENKGFVRISKSCIVNMKHVEKFDISQTGKIVVKLDDSSEQVVSRRKTANIMKYLEERRI